MDACAKGAGVEVQWIPSCKLGAYPLRIGWEALLDGHLDADACVLLDKPRHSAPQKQSPRAVREPCQLIESHSGDPLHCHGLALLALQEELPQVKMVQLTSCSTQAEHIISG